MKVRRYADLDLGDSVGSDRHEHWYVRNGETGQVYRAACEPREPRVELIADPLELTRDFEGGVDWRSFEVVDHVYSFFFDRDKARWAIEMNKHPISGALMAYSVKNGDENIARVLRFYLSLRDTDPEKVEWPEKLGDGFQVLVPEPAESE